MRASVLGLLLISLAAPARAADLKLEFRDGKVTLDARDVSLRQILTEWARVGQTKIVNLERLGAGTLTLQLTAVPERQALDTILRSVSGYMAAPRPMGGVGASAYDRILILATSTVVSVRPPVAPPTFPSPASGSAAPRRVIPQTPGAPAMVQPEPFENDDGIDEDDPAPEQVTPNRGVVTFGPQQPGILNQPGTIAQPPGAADPLRPGADDTGSQKTAPAPANPWTIPVGSATPGMVTVPPQRPAQSAPRPPQPDR